MLTKKIAHHIFIGWLVTLVASLSLRGQTVTQVQQLAFAGLRSVATQGQFNAVAADSTGNIYLLLDQKDGVRVLKVDPELRDRRQPR